MSSLLTTAVSPPVKSRKRLRTAPGLKTVKAHRRRRTELSDIRRDPDHYSSGLLAAEAQSRPDPQFMSQRIDVLPHALRRGLTDDDNGRGASAIRGQERTPSRERDPHRLEIVRRDEADLQRQRILLVI